MFWRERLNKHTPKLSVLSHLFAMSRFFSSPRFAERAKSSRLKFSEHSTEDCDGCHFIPFSRTNSTHFSSFSWVLDDRRRIMTIRSLSTHVFETRTATGSELFSLLTRFHTTKFTLLSIFSPLEMIRTKIWETPLSWHVKCSLPVAVRVSKTRVLKLPNL